MKKILSVSILLLAYVLGFGQANKPILTAIPYRSADNPYYWKNRKPFDGYWQQDVEYKIKANIDETTDIIDATQTLTYHNNSPHDLPYVYFHLYQNMTLKGGYLEQLTLNNNTAVKPGKYEEQGLGTVIEDLTIDGQKPVQIIIDQTVMKIVLPKPLKSGESVKFDIKFKTYFDSGSQRRRMKKFNSFGNTHYDGVHWYPRICVYDRKMGWDVQQHLGKEFYGDYGSYDVELTFSDNYVVEATGLLQNKNEVLPTELRMKLDIGNFLRKPWESPPSVITPYNKDNRKTWKYYGVNVHDFAFTADPTYRIGEVSWNGIQIVALVQEPHAAGWWDAANFTSKVIKTYSEDFGMYAYPKMVVADARDGMEYPMLTLDGGFTPDYHGLLAHEVGHNWFFGMVGSNETYRASLDEGFTQFLTAWSLIKIDGDTLKETRPQKKYVNKYTRDDLAIDSRVYYPYLLDAVRMDETTLNTHSDDFNGALAHGGGYRNVYFKTATMLYNLQYVLGDSLFLGAMSHYFNKWKIAHPYMEDFRDAITEYTKTDLTWFFDQWIETSKVIDYKVECVKKVKGEDDAYEITLKRNGKMQMPIDLRVVGKDGKQYDYYIPNTWFEKNTTATKLPKWYGWDKINPTYTFKVTIPGGVKSVQIDPSYRLADNYILDNSKGIKNTDHYFDAQIPNMPNWRHREVYWRPEVWGNAYDFLKVGFNVNGNYMNSRKVFDFTFWVSTWTNGNKLLTENNGFNYADRSNLDRFNFRFNYKDALDRVNKGMGYNINVRLLDGVFIGQIGLDQWNRKLSTRYYVNFKVMSRYDDNYLFNPTLWSGYGPNNTVNVGFDHKYAYLKGNGNINVNLRSSALSEFNYSQLSTTAINQNTLGKFEVKTRFFAQLGIGQNTPLESALYIAGANPEQMMDNKFTRARGFFPAEWAAYGMGTNNFHHGGGMNLRGYAGYNLPNQMTSDLNNTTYNNFYTRSGIAGNVEVEFDRLVKWKPKKISDYIKFNTYLFVDAGYVVNHLGVHESFNSSYPNLKNKFLADAGLGVALTIKRWGNLFQAKPLTVRFDMPFWLSEKPQFDNSNFKFRWVLGVSRAF
jgi:hypothetical protein